MRTLLVVAFALTATPAFAQSRLLGVDATGKQAFVIREDGGWALETVDVDKRDTLATWSASPANVDDRTGIKSLIKFSPVDGTFETDLVKFAAFVARSGLASRPYWVNVQRTASGIVYQNESSIELANKSGAHLETLGEGSNPRVSPDGKLIAWTSFDSTSITVVAAKKATKPTVAKIGDELRGVQWSVDGKSVLSLTSDGCVHRLDARTMKDKTLHCESGHTLLVQDPTGRTLATAGPRGLVWLDAKSGKQVGEKPPTSPLSMSGGTPTIDFRITGVSLSSDDATLGANGLFVALGSDPTELFLFDLRKQAGKKLTANTFYEGVRATRWTGSTIVVLDGDRVTRIDVAQSL